MNSSSRCLAVAGVLVIGLIGAAGAPDAPTAPAGPPLPTTALEAPPAAAVSNPFRRRSAPAELATAPSPVARPVTVSSRRPQAGPAADRSVHFDDRELLAYREPDAFRSAVRELGELPVKQARLGSGSGAAGGRWSATLQRAEAEDGALPTVAKDGPGAVLRLVDTADAVWPGGDLLVRVVDADAGRVEQLRRARPQLREAGVRELAVSVPGTDRQRRRLELWSLDPEPVRLYSTTLAAADLATRLSANGY